VWNDDATNVAVVSWRFWQRSLSGDAGVIGRTMLIDGTPREIVGVMPESFLAPFGAGVDLWMPLNMRPLLADTARARRTVTAIARLTSGTLPEQANAYLEAFSGSQRSQYPSIHAREAWVVQPLRESLVGSSQPALVGTGAAAVLLMLIVWANIAGLSAVNAAARRHLHAIRAALGASATQLFRERLTDNLVVALAGSLVGLGMAYGLTLLAATYQQQFLPLLAPIAFDAATAVVGLLLGIVTGVCAAVAPHGSVKRLQVEDPLRAARGTTGDRRLAAMRSALVLVQVAVAMVLIVGAALLVRTVSHLSGIAMGFDSQHLTNFHVTLPLPRYRPSERQVQFERDIRERIAAIPGVTGVSASVGFPGMGTMGARVTVLDRPNETQPEIAYYSVSPDFFAFLGVPILQGRDIADTDDFPAPRVVVVNETMARLLWPQGNAIGAKVKIGAGAATDREITVVGISSDVRQHGPTQDVRPTAYGSTLQYSWPQRHLAVKTAGPVGSLSEELRRAVHAVDPAIAYSTASPMDEVVWRQTARHRLVMLTLVFFGTVATVLCAFGLYATVALSSQFRRREYAIRVALGSSRSGVCWLVVRHALLLASAGAGLGLTLAAAGTDVLSGLLHGVTPVDHATFSATFVAMILLAAAAASVPALRAGSVDPVETLRAE
jgi:putative ABC transport system permease protein